MKPVTLSVIVLTLNEERNIGDCLASVRDFADELIVLDSGSFDRTIAIAHDMGARVETRPFDNYPKQRNAALTLAHSDWAFFIDADERATPALGVEIRERIAGRGEAHLQEKGSVSAGAPANTAPTEPAVVRFSPLALRPSTLAGYWAPRRNIIFGKEIRHTGWYPDYQPRLLRKGAARFDPDREVHELVIWEGETGNLTEPLIHHNYQTLAQFRSKQQIYTRFEARVWYQEGKRARLRSLFGQPVREFVRRFFVLQGWRDGWHGLLLSALMAYYAFRRQVILWGMGHKEQGVGNTAKVEKKV